LQAIHLARTKTLEKPEKGKGVEVKKEVKEEQIDTGTLF